MANRKDMAKIHARRTHTCPLCGQKSRGNGGRASHRRKHIAEAGLDERDFVDLDSSSSAHARAWRAAYKKLKPKYGKK